ncbi:uncharacterized protein LOC141825588 [Curcuma longa]|uniref:uncharacterized protein LOC141825588 n=1 Tax=Curcuma longa TaxID=136217 RepID=UPI003D9EAA84
MDPCPFVRVLVGNLALKIPVATRSAGAGVHNSSFPCFAKIRLDKSPCQTTAVPLVSPEEPPSTPSAALAARFNLSKADLDRIYSKSSIFALNGSGARLRVSVYTGRRGTTCGVTSGRLLGEVTVTLDLKSTIAEGGGNRAVVFHSGWVELSKKNARKGSSSPAQLYLTVRADPDPRFVFEFDGEPECSPQVFQVQGNIRQPVFTCKFCCRSAGTRNSSARSMNSQRGSSGRCFPSFGSERDRTVKERKGWSVTVHDLSGSPVALASMVTPFVASPGTDKVSRSNPGAWLLLRPGDGTWKPWGRLEAWRERGGASSGDGLGYRFELLAEAATGAGINIAESTLSATKGGKFNIDLTSAAGTPLSRSTSPGCSPRGSGDFGHATWPFSSYRGFVMSSTVAGEGRNGRPTVEVGVQHVACAEDAAAFVALAAAIDLSMNACRLFSHKLRRELSSPDLLR